MTLSFSLGIFMFFALMILGLPIWSALATTGGYWILFTMNMNSSLFAPSFFTAMDKWVLLAVPYFLVAGNIMAYCGSAESIVEFIDDSIGHLRGGLAIAAVFGCAIFGAISGAATATVAAIGTIILPQMLKLNYDKNYSMGLLAASGILGTMIPPSIYMIIFASIVQMDVAVFFVAGIVPGLLISLLLIAPAVYFTHRKDSEEREARPAKVVFKSFLHSIPAFITPVCVLGGIYGGVFTPTEAGAIACIYALFISKFYYKQLTKETLVKSLTNGMATTAVIFFILGGATLFANALMITGAPQKLTHMVVSNNISNIVLLFNIALLYLILGCFLDAVPILYITLPLVWPIAKMTNLNPVHLCIVTVACMMLAMVTPPFGLNLFVTSGFMKEKVENVLKGVIPYLITLAVGVVLIIVFPQISTWLPEKLGMFK